MNTWDNHICVAMSARVVDGVKRPMGQFDGPAIKYQRFGRNQSVDTTDIVVQVM